MKKVVTIKKPKNRSFYISLSVKLVTRGTYHPWILKVKKIKKHFKFSPWNHHLSKRWIFSSNNFQNLDYYSTYFPKNLWSKSDFSSVPFFFLSTSAVKKNFKIHCKKSEKEEGGNRFRKNNLKVVKNKVSCKNNFLLYDRGGVSKDWLLFLEKNFFFFSKIKISQRIYCCFLEGKCFFFKQKIFFIIFQQQ
jgi:hypothetical protein